MDYIVHSAIGRKYKKLDIYAAARGVLVHVYEYNRYLVKIRVFSGDKYRITVAQRGLIRKIECNKRDIAKILQEYTK